MASPTNLIGLGMPFPLANKVGMTIAEVTIAGATVGAATQIPGNPGVYYVIASNSGSGVKLPVLGGVNGCLPGDEFVVVNNFSSSILVYAANNAKGSVVTLVGNGGTITGSTGTSLVNAHVAIFRAVNISTWAYIKTSA